jgi:hypothetical protein
MPEEKYSIEFYLKPKKENIGELDKVESLMLIDALQNLYPKDESIQRLSHLYRNNVISFVYDRNEKAIYILFKEENVKLPILENKLRNVNFKSNFSLP